MFYKDFEVRLVQGDLSDSFAMCCLREDIGIDVETTGLDPFSDKLKVVTVSNYFCRQIEIIRVEGSGMSNLVALLGDEGVNKIFHHARFDLSFLYSFLRDCVPTSKVYCTKVLAKVMGEASASLAPLVGKYLNTDLKKDKSITLSGFDGCLTEEQINYCCNDVIYLKRLYDKLSVGFTAENVMTYHSVMRLVPVMAAADALGFDKFRQFLSY